MDTTREIPQEQWHRFFDEFSNIHTGWRVSLEILQAETGAALQAQAVSLQGVLADLRGDHGNITFLLGRHSEGGDLAHTVCDVTHVHLRKSADGADRTLQVTSTETTTLLHVLSPTLSEQVDGTPSIHVRT